MKYLAAAINRIMERGAAFDLLANNMFVLIYIFFEFWGDFRIVDDVLDRRISQKNAQEI